MKILVISFSHIGDAIISTCVISPLRSHFPGCHLCYLLNPSSRAVLEGDPQIDEVLIYENRGRHRGIKGKMALVRELRRGKFDLIVDLRNTPWSRFLGAPVWKIKTEFRRSRRHAVERFLEPLAGHGINTAGAQPRVELTADEMSIADELLPVNEGGFLGIHPGGGWSYKFWEPEKFAELADRLSAELGVRVLLFAGPDEKHLGEQVKSLSSHEVIDCMGVPIRTAAALIGRCRLYIGNDTGTTHLAAALGVPTIAIFGATDHLRSGPYGDHCVSLVGKLRKECAPCHPGRRPGRCGRDVRCPVVSSVTVDEVFDTALKLDSRFHGL